MQGPHQQAMFGNGTVARCLREIDWAGHELGPVENWPESLRVALATVLAAKAPMQLFWGPQALLFYNDACIPGLGAGHPSVLGRPAPEALRSFWTTTHRAIERCRTEAIVVEHAQDTFTPIPGGVVRALGDTELPLAAKAELVAPRPAVTTKIMLVEDNDDAACALKTALEQLGYVVVVAHNGPIALNVAQVFAPEIVLLDIGLPVMDGWELARRIRERCQNNVTFVAVTARDQESDRELSAELGFVEHFVKPVDVAELQRIVEGIARRN